MEEKKPCGENNRAKATDRDSGRGCPERNSALKRLSVSTRQFGLLRGSSSGTAVVESAFILILFFTLMLALVEISWFLGTQHILTNAAREGARLAVTPEVGSSSLPSDAQIESFVDVFLDSRGITGATVTIGRNITDPPREDVFTMVTVEAPYQVFAASIFTDLEITLAGRSKMRNETSP